MVFDTNILIYYLNQTLPPSGRQFVDQAIQNTAFISVVSRLEILGWPGHTEESIKKAEHLLLQNFNEYPLTEVIVRRCIGLRRQRSIRLPDAIIAATALHLQMPLVTRNTQDFGNLDTLSFVNPFAI